MTVTPIRTRRRAPRTTTPDVNPRIAELEAMLTDPRYKGWADELQAARDELVQLTAQHILAA